MKKVKISINSPVILGFSLVCCIATLLNYITGGESNRVLFMTYHSPLTNIMTYVRFVTHVFGHANWAHLIGNLSFILLLGPMLEEKYGRGNVVEIILLTAVATALINYIFFPRIALCGASGVVFAFILLASFSGFKQGEIPLTLILVALIYIGEQIYEGLTVDDNISNMAHIIGGIVGTIAGYSYNKKPD